MDVLYSPVAWSSFFLAVAGAGAALCGLVFVSLSLNLDRIKRSKALVGRAGEAVSLLLSTVVFSLIDLIPENTPKLTGTLLLVAGIGLWIFVVRLQKGAYEEQ